MNDVPVPMMDSLSSIEWGHSLFYYYFLHSTMATLMVIQTVKIEVLSHRESSLSQLLHDTIQSLGIGDVLNIVSHSIQ